MSAATNQELAVLQILENHRPTHQEYEGGWWELACTGCDFAKDQRLSHMDRTPHAAHRAEVFHEALKSSGVLNSVPDFKTEWGVKSPWGCDASKDRETAESVAGNMRDAGHEATVVWRGVTEWHHTITDERAMHPVEEPAAEKAIEQIREAMDSLFKGQSTPTEAVRQIVKHLSDYEAQV